MRFLLFWLLFLLPINFAFAQTQPKPILVTVAPVTEGISSPTMDVTGSVYFALNSSVAAESSGKVAKVFINEGDFVKAGANLASLDDQIISYNIKNAQASANQAKTNLDKAKRDYERLKSLFAQQAVSQQAYENAMTDVQNAENAYAALLATENRLSLEKEKMLIKSPFDGVITSKNVNVGEWVSTGGTVASVAALDFEAKIYLPERVLQYVKTGDIITVTVGEKEFKGKILSVNSKGDPSTRTFLTRISLGNNKFLREGFMATAKVPVGEANKTLLVPRDAVITLNNEKGVYKVNGEAVLFVPVFVTANVGGNLAITPKSNLDINDKVVMSGNDKINAGSKIKITQGLVK